MPNRRKDYRLALADDPLPAELLLPGSKRPLVGAVVNLSISGMALRLPEDLPTPTLEEVCQVTFTLPSDRRRLPIQARAVYVSRRDDGNLCGLSFLPLSLESATEERERAIWLFLLDEQRRRRQVNPPHAGS